MLTGLCLCYVLPAVCSAAQPVYGQHSSAWSPATATAGSRGHCQRASSRRVEYAHILHFTLHSYGGMGCAVSQEVIYLNFSYCMNKS